MDNHSSHPTFVFKVNINCCKACPAKLKKKLLKINGVDSVVLDAQKRLVYVTGNVDPTLLIKMIKKLGKNAELMSHDKEPMNEKNNIEDNFENKQTSKNKCPDKKQCHDTDNDNVSRKGTTTDHDHYCCQEDNFVRHKVEDYVPPQRDETFDNRVCRDRFCKLHSRNHIIRDKVNPLPPRGSAAEMFWQHPGWYREELHPYDHYPRTNIPPFAYGHGHRRHVSRFDNFFSDDNTRGCSIL